VRLYLVKQNEKPNFESPIIMKKGQSLTDVAKKIGEDFAEEKKEAVIWGTGAKFPSQEVSLSTEVKEGMQIRFI
ncbi:TGS domain-containing protein, partial [Candidatus Woesebacteria bacterium]